MSSRQDTRPTTVHQEVTVYTCDSCGTEVWVDRYESPPPGWLSVGDGTKNEGLFCSKECLTRWAAGASPTSADLTKIAREQFAKTTGTYT